MTTATAVKPSGHKESAKPVQSQKQGVIVTIPAPNFQTVQLKIIGTAPLVINKFSAKARQQIIATQEAGNRAKSKKVREPKNFETVYQDARHISHEGWDGFAAGGIRAAMVSACKTCGFVMTKAKLAISIVADGFDKDDGTPLVRIYGTPKKHTKEARNDNGSIDMRVRPMFEQWHAMVRVKFDADMLSIQDIGNLLSRAGQAGIGEGRPDSPNSVGCGWGTFMCEGKQ